MTSQIFRSLMLNLVCSLVVVMTGAVSFAQGTRPLGTLLIHPNFETEIGESVFDFGQAQSTENPEGQIIAKILISNDSPVDIASLVGTILNPHFRFADGPYPGKGGTCGRTLVSGASCFIVMSFKPTSQGAKRGVVRMNYWEGSVPSTSYRVLTGEVL